ncbi:MAG: toll/interleukin-1 receptor domain-containing protein [Gammaproteobacteria bacterium]|nr:toll/interleukin-1 receptor domain-containing protein [Gammaproteobacteria bacterium]
MTDFMLLPKIPPALRRLRGHYYNKGETDLGDLIELSRFHIEPETHYDNWNGGTYGHDVLFFVPEEKMDSIDLDDQQQISNRITQDLNKVITDVENEHVNAVHIKLADESDPDYQKTFPFSRRPHPRPEDVGLWGDGNRLRLFISHLAEHKAIAHRITEAMEPFGVSTFVAHDNIKPMKEWQKEILNGLMTMEVMVVLLTDGIHKSVWTNQEIGFALGKGIPIICLKVGAQDPEGFIGSIQALKVSSEDIASLAPELFRALVKVIGQEERHKEILIEAFVSSKSYLNAMANLKRLTQVVYSLNDADINRIKEGYAQNDQLYNCAGIHNSRNGLIQYLERVTGKEFELKDREIIEVKPYTDDIPF